MGMSQPCDVPIDNRAKYNGQMSFPIKPELLCEGKLREVLA